MDSSDHPASVMELLSSPEYQISYFQCPCTHEMINSNKDAFELHLNGKSHKQGIEAVRILDIGVNDDGNISCFCGQEIINDKVNSLSFTQIKAHVGRQRHTDYLLQLSKMKRKPEATATNTSAKKKSKTKQKSTTKKQQKLNDFFSLGKNSNQQPDAQATVQHKLQAGPVSLMSDGSGKSLDEPLVVEDVVPFSKLGDQMEVEFLGQSESCMGIIFPNWPKPFMKNYPFAEHAVRALPWNVSTEGVFRHQNCGGVQLHSNQEYCSNCASLITSTELIKMLERSSLVFTSSEDMAGRGYDTLTHEQSIFMAKCYKEQRESLRLTQLNLARKLESQAKALDNTSRFIVAISENDYARLSQLVRAGLKNGDSITAIQAKFDLAIEGSYSCKSFSEKKNSSWCCGLKIGWTASS